MWIVLATLAVGGSLTLRAQPDGPATNAAATNAIAAPAARGETNGDAMRVPERTAPAPHASASASTTSRTDFAAFRVIAEHNIFNGNRSGQRITSTRSGSLQRSVRVDAFTLVGTLDSGKGWLAFFDGTQSDYHKVLRAGDSIAGFKVKEIIYSGVRFDENGAELALRVGSSLRREDGGAWFVSATSGSYASSRAGESHSSYNGSGGSSTTVSSSNSDGGAAPSGAMSDVLKRLMERREKE